MKVTEREWERNYYPYLETWFYEEGDADIIVPEIESRCELFKQPCPTCKGLKEYRSRNDGVVRCNCRLQKRLHFWYHYSGIGDLYQRLDWEDFEDITDDAFQWAINYVLNYDKMSYEGLGAFMLGKNGTGKSFLAALIAKEFVKFGKRVCFRQAQEILDDYTKTWKDPDERDIYESTLLGATLLVVDDLGKEQKTAWALPTLERLIRTRIQNNKPTIITTNLVEADFKKEYAESLSSLLKEQMKAILFKGEDFRLRAHEDKKENIRFSWVRPIV